MVLYTIKLSKLEVEELNKVISKGSHTSQAYRAAYILLNCDKGEFSTNADIKNADICKVLRVGERTIDRVKKKFIEEGFDSVLERRASQQNYTKKVDGDIEAKLVTLCCSEPPEGFAKWSLRLLADKMVELNYVDYISHVTVGEVLKKTNLSPGKLKVGLSRRNKAANL
jgi:transposase